LQTLSWRELDSNFRFPATVNLVVAPLCAARLLGMDRRTGAGVPRFSSFVMRGKPFHDAGFHKGGVGLLCTRPTTDC
jgi:hypothetical protein